MRWSDIPFRPSERTLRQFAVLWIVFFLLAALLHWLVFRNHTTAIVFAALATTIGPIGVVKPAWMRPIFVAWMVLAFPIGWLISNVVLALVFYCLLTPLALVFRLIGRDPLSLRRRNDQETYWTVKSMPNDRRRYFRQF